MIMSIIPERPKSVDTAEENRKTYLKEIDYTGSVMYSEVLRRKSIKEAKRLGQDIPGIEERDDEEDEKIGSSGKKGKRTSQLELQGQPSSLSIKGPMEAENPNCYSPIEIEYLIHILKNKSGMSQAKKNEDLETIHTKARKTLKVHMKKLLLKRQFYHIDAQYKLAENEKQTKENILKLLVRNQKMHEAQNEITKILMLIHQRMDKVMSLRMDIKNRAEEPHIEKVVKKLYTDSVRLSSRIYIAI